METLDDINDGVAPFPAVGDTVIDPEWAEESSYGKVIKADYPRYTLAWDDGWVATEKVRY